MFRVGSQCGLSPDQVLDMDFDTLNAVIEGYQDKMFDLQLLTAHAGYWSGYFGHSKKPKPLDKILEKLWNKKNKQQHHVDTVDVEGFLQQEAEFKAKLLKRS